MHTHGRSTRTLVALVSAIACAITVSGCTDERGPTGPESVAANAAQGPGGTFISIDYPGATFTSVTGINSRGEIVGQYMDAANNRHGFVRDGEGTYRPIIYPGAPSSIPAGINGRSDVVGSYSDGSRDHGFVLRHGTFSVFSFTVDSTVAYHTFGFGINGSGDIVGEYKLVKQPLGVPGHAFLYSDGTFKHIDPPGAQAAVAFAINSRGQSVGYFLDQQVPSVGHGWLRDAHGDYTVIDYPGAAFTNARGITPSGVIVGLYRDASGKSHGFVLEGDTFISIDYPGSTFTRLLGINARGDIVGDYRDASNKQHGFLLSH